MLSEPIEIDEFKLAASLNYAILLFTNAIMYTLLLENQYP